MSTLVTALGEPTPFNPSDAGTDEASWLEFLQNAAAWEPRFDALIVVGPHPDDETLGAGGLISMAVARGVPVTVISVTDGEQARPAEPDLSVRRRAELAAAMKCLATADGCVEIIRLQVPDGEVQQRQSFVSQRVVELSKPGALLAVPFEHDGHPDHDATARACIQAAKRVDITVARYPIWAWHRLQPSDLSGFELARLELTAAARRDKAKALQCFHSQFDEHPDGAIVPPHVLTHFARPFETFFL